MKQGVRGNLYYQSSAKKCCSGFIRTTSLVNQAKEEIITTINNSGKAYASPRPSGIIIQTSCYCEEKKEDCEAVKLVEMIKTKYRGLNEESAKVNKLYDPRLQISCSNKDADFEMVEKTIQKNFPDHAEEIKFKKVVTSRINRKGNAKLFIVEADPKTRAIIAGHNVNTESGRIFIRDSILVRFCSNCYNYGHSRSRCRNQQNTASEGQEQPQAMGNQNSNPITDYTNPNLIPITVHPQGQAQVANNGFVFPFINYGPPNYPPTAHFSANEQPHHHPVNENSIVCHKCSTTSQHHPLSIKCYQRYKEASKRVALINYGVQDDNKVVLWEL